MKKLSLLISVCVLNGSCFSQPLLQKIIGGSAYDDANKVIATADEGFASIGSTESFGAGQSDLLFVKYDSLLNIQWARAYGSAGNDYGTSCVQLANGSYMLAGFSYGLSNDTNYSDMLIIRITSTGLVQWAKTAGGNKSDEALDIALTTDAYVVLAGNTASGFQPSPQSAYSAKFDLNGNMKWSKAYYTDSISFFKSVSPIAAGGVVFGGSCTVPLTSLYDIYIVRADTGGTPVWSKRFGGNESDYGNGIKSLTTSEILVTGHTKSFGAGGWDAYLLKLNSSGNSLWLKTYGTINFEKGTSVSTNQAGWYIVCGMSGASKALGIKTDTSGTMLNRKEFRDTTVAISGSVANSLTVSVDSGFVILGKTQDFGASNGDIYLLKSDRVFNTSCNQNSPVFTSGSHTPSDTAIGTSVSAGTSLYVTGQIITTAVNLSQTILCTPLEINELFLFPVRIFPNPAVDFLNIDFSKIEFRQLTVVLKSINGQTIYSSINLTNRMLSIPLKNLDAGLYFLQMSSEKGTKTEKINIIK